MDFELFEEQKGIKQAAFEFAKGEFDTVSLGCAQMRPCVNWSLEKSPFLGGRAPSFKYNDDLLDVGMHVMSLGDVSPTEELLRRVEIKVHYAWTEGLDFYTHKDGGISANTGKGQGRMRREISKFKTWFLFVMVIWS